VTVPGWIEGVFIALRSTSRQARAVKAAVGLGAFVIVTWWAWRSVGGISLVWGWVTVLLVVGVPLAIFILTAEQHVSTKLAAVNVSVMSSFRTAVTASAANYLPIPGAALVRIGALTKAGSGAGRATTVAATLGVIWLSVTAMATVPGLLIADRWVVAVGASAGGVAVLVATVAFLRTRYAIPVVVLALSVGVVVLKVAINGLTIYVGMRAVGAIVSPWTALLVSASSVIASALGIAPGGLGIREFFSGVLAAIGGVDPALATLGTVVERAVMTVGLGAAILVAASMRSTDVEATEAAP
jgi:hypothetical protein